MSLLGFVTLHCSLLNPPIKQGDIILGQVLLHIGHRRFLLPFDAQNTFAFSRSSGNDCFAMVAAGDVSIVDLCLPLIFSGFGVSLRSLVFFGRPAAEDEFTAEIADGYHGKKAQCIETRITVFLRSRSQLADKGNG